MSMKTSSRRARVPEFGGAAPRGAAVVVLSATHYIGVKEGARVQGFFTLLIVATMAGLCVRHVHVVPGARGGRRPGAITHPRRRPMVGPLDVRRLDPDRGVAAR